MIVDGTALVKIRHPIWLSRSTEWKKWRLTYKGGEDFNDEYIEKFSHLENLDDFKARKKVSPTPCFAKSVVNEIKNSIFQRMADIKRQGGPETYQKAAVGQSFGVDLHGTSMNTFMGREVVPELLTMAKVGVWVDMPPVTGPTFVDSKTKTPYLYVYKAEEILSWSYRKDRIEEFRSILLVDWLDKNDEVSGMPNGSWKRHRYCWIDDQNQVWVMLFNENGTQIDLEGNATSEAFKLDLPYIPFITLELTDSLLTDVSNHQVALANLESSDMAYTLKSNFPIFIEQVDDRDFSQHLKGPGEAGSEGTQAEASASDPREVTVGNSVGRRYRSGLDAPGFINPSSDPVKLSMEKQKALKEDIRQLVNLSLSNIKPKMASAESKAFDQQGLESGLAYIGLEMERGERQIARIWAAYEKTNDVPIITYPEKWSLVSDEERRKNAEQLEELRDTVPSPTFQKLMNQQIVGELIGNKVDADTITTINNELKAAKSVTANPDTIFMAVDKGILSLELASVLLGFPKDEPEKAAQDHADKLSRILKSQMAGKPAGPAGAGARGVPAASANPADGKDEKAESRDTTQKGSSEEPVRGEGK